MVGSPLCRLHDLRIPSLRRIYSWGVDPAMRIVLTTLGSRLSMPFVLGLVVIVRQIADKAMCF